MIEDEKIDSLVGDYLRGHSQAKVAVLHNISLATVKRYLRRRNIALTAEEIKRRKQNGGRIPSGNFKSPTRLPRSRVSTAVVLGRRFCITCKHWRHLIYFDARERDEDGYAFAWQSVCQTCSRIRNRRRRGLERRGVPYEARRTPLTPEQRLERRRELYHQHKCDPDWMAERREYSRIYNEAKRREQGIPRRSESYYKHSSRSTRVVDDPLLPLAPFQRWIESMLEDRYDALYDLASASKISERALFRFRRGFDSTSKGRIPITSIHLGTADRCISNESTYDLWEIYPSLYDVHDDLYDEFERS